MSKKESVNQAESLDAEDQDREVPEGEGKNLSADLEKKVRENLRAEYERKSKEQIDGIKADYEDRIAELEEKTKLTPKEVNELESLQSQVDAIERNPDAKAWIALQRKIAREEAEKRDSERMAGTIKSDEGRALNWVKKKSEELKIDQVEFENELADILSGNRWNNELPSARVQLAYEHWQKIQDRVAKSKTKPDAEFSEGRGRAPRNQSASEELKQARESGNFQSILSKIAKKQEEMAK